MTDDFTLDALGSMSVSRLEELWARDVALEPPRGVFRGHALARLDHPTARRALWRLSEKLGFEWLPFGIDFDRRLWFFIAPRVALGRFEVRPGRSRWRDTDALGLHYESSRLPSPLRRVLYDEVKPLSPRFVLGLGGIDAERGVGDHFFFVLERVERPR